MALNRFFQTQVSTLSPYIQAAATTLNKSTATIHVRQGFKEYIEVFTIWDAKRARHIIEASFHKNILQFLLPLIIFRVTIDTFRKQNKSDAWHNVIDVIDYTILLTFFLRIYLRRLLDNTFYSIALTRAVNEDVKDHLCDVVAEVYSQQVTNLFPEHDAAMQTELQAAIKILWNKYFQHAEPSPVIFKLLIEPLEKTLLVIIEKYTAETKAKPLAALLSKIICRQLSEMFKANDELQATEDKKQLAELVTQVCRQFSEIFRANDEIQATEDKKQLAELVTQVRAEIFMEESKRAREAISLFMPIHHLPACQCDLKYKMAAGIASPVYFIFNDLLTTVLPTQLAGLAQNSFLLEKFILGAGIAANMLVYGQGFNEYRIIQESQCTYHRYRAFSGNKAHSLGIGMGYWLANQVCIQAIKLIFNVDNTYSRGAIANMMLQLGAITVLAFNHKLPGKRTDQWDYFYGPKAALNFSYDTLVWLRKPPEPPKPTEADKKEIVQSETPYEKIQSAYNSKLFLYIFNLLFGKEEFIPRADLFRPENLALDDPWRLLFSMPSFNQFYKLYRADIEGGINTVKSIHTISTWTPEILLRIPVSGFLAILILSTLQMMKNPSLDNLMKSTTLVKVLSYYQAELKPDEAVAVLQHELKELLETHVDDQAIVIGQDAPPAPPVTPLKQSEPLEKYELVHEEKVQAGTFRKHNRPKGMAATLFAKAWWDTQETRTAWTKSIFGTPPRRHP